MAQPSTTRGRYFGLKLGDGAETEAFTKTCLVNSSIGLEMSSEVAATIVKDCADDDVIPWAINDKVSSSATLSGEGTLGTADIAAFTTWLNDSATKNIELEIYATAANGEKGSLFGTFTGAAHLTQFSVSAPDGERATASVALTFSGAVTFTAE